MQYAAWGVDYLKYDWCNTSTQDAPAAYALIRNALNATGRPIVLSICEWGTAKPWLWGEKVGGNLWRTTGDISDQWAEQGQTSARRARHPRSAGWTRELCRARATGTIRTCSKSATEA